MSKEQRIKELEIELTTVKGTTCDVYSRVVGYHTPVRNWNTGKIEEFKNRSTFDDSFK